MEPLAVVLHPTDFSACAAQAFEAACAIAREHQARLIALHVAPTRARSLGLEPDEGRPDHECDPEALEARLREMRPPEGGVDLEYRLAEGDAVEEILRVAEETGCDLIVMGSHGRSELWHMVMGSITEAVRRRSPRRVLTVPPPVSARTYAADAPRAGWAKE